MNFKTFMYYCALCGGWAALIVWALQEFSGMANWGNAKPLFQKGTAIGALLGLLLAAVIGLLDAILNSVGFARVVRVLMSVAVGLMGSLVFAYIGEWIRDGVSFVFPGWMMVGFIIGAALGVFDVVRSVGAGGKGMKQAIRKVINGIIGGTIGGFIGGALNDAFNYVPWPFDDAYDTMKARFPKWSLAVGLVILGMCIGLLIGVAQVVLKEAWVRVEKGFRSGREMILSKPETSIGRAEGVDIALFGDMQVEKQHARIVLKGDRYVLIDGDTPGGTLVNGQRISGPYPLKNGDLIGAGNSLVRFQEKTKR
jgi:hypothetical protein